MNIFEIFNSVYNSKSYILYSDFSKSCWLVDCGDSEPILEWLFLNEKELVGIFITHTHLDHIYGLNAIVAKCPDVVVYTSFEGEKGLYSERLNLSHYKGLKWIFEFDNVICLKENSIVKLFPNINMSVLETPGHDVSSLTYYCVNHIFTGDSYMCGNPVITRLPMSDKKQSLNSVVKILDITKRNGLSIYCGH